MQTGVPRAVRRGGENAVRSHDRRIERIVALRRSGKTFAEIGDELGTTRQRVYQLVKTATTILGWPEEAFRRNAAPKTFPCKRCETPTPFRKMLRRGLCVDCWNLRRCIVCGNEFVRAGRQKICQLCRSVTRPCGACGKPIARDRGSQNACFRYTAWYCDRKCFGRYAGRAFGAPALKKHVAQAKGRPAQARPPDNRPNRLAISGPIERDGSRVATPNKTPHAIRRLLAGAAIVALLVAPSPAVGRPPATASTPAVAAAAAPGPDKPIRIVDVAVRGTERVPLETIRRAIESRPGEHLDRDRVRRDVERILALGLFADVVVRVQPARDGAHLVFLVVENPVVARIEIAGNAAIPADEIRRALGAAEGEILNLVALRAGARNVERMYRERGYVLARVADAEFAPDGALRVTIREGALESIQLRGLARTRPEFVQRMLAMREGEIFNIHRVNRDLHEIFGTGLFENIRAVPRPGDGPDTAALAIELEERPTREIGFGVGFSPEQGFLGSLRFVERNLHGMGRTISLSYSRNVGGIIGDVGVSPLTGLPAENLAISYRDPWFLERNQSLAIELRHTSQLVDDPALGARFLQTTTGGSVALTRQLGDAWTASLSLRTERAAFAIVAGDPAQLHLSPGLTHALRVETAYDLRDDPRNPRRGFRATGSVESAFRLFGGDFDFTKYRAEYAHFLPLGQGTLAGRVSVAASSGFLPVQEQFAFGGAHSFRGLPAGALRGSSTALATVEYRLPLAAVFPDLRDVTAVAFADFGGASRTGFGLVDALQFAYGVGVLVNTPIGPIRIDHAIGPNGRTQTWLSFGHSF